MRQKSAGRENRLNYFDRQICTSSMMRSILSPETERAVSPKVSPPAKINKTTNYQA